ncbi:hypothetical protein ACIRD9_11195 [Streptomyces violaceus]
MPFPERRVGLASAQTVVVAAAALAFTDLALRRPAKEGADSVG